MEIIDSYWFSPAGNMPVIGIVKVRNEMGEIKYYIGTSAGLNQDADSKNIAQYGAKFPKSIGETLF